MAAKMIFALVAALLVASAAANKIELPKGSTASLTFICSTDTTISANNPPSPICQIVTAGPVTSVVATCPTGYQAIGGFCSTGTAATLFGSGLTPFPTNLNVPGGGILAPPTLITSQTCVGVNVIPQPQFGPNNLGSQVWCQKISTKKDKN